MMALQPAISRRLGFVLALALTVLVLVQVGLVNFLPTPWAAPDLVTLVVTALAVSRGPVVGALAGAGAGLTLDLVPPAAGPLGSWLLVLTLVAAAVGRVSEIRQAGPFSAMAAVAIGSGAVVLGQAAIAWFAGSPASIAVVGQALATSAWGLLLAPLALILLSPRERGPHVGAMGSPAVGRPGRRLGRRLGGRV